MTNFVEGQTWESEDVAIYGNGAEPGDPPQLTNSETCVTDRGRALFQTSSIFYGRRDFQGQLYNFLQMIPALWAATGGINPARGPIFEYASGTGGKHW